MKNSKILLVLLLIIGIVALSGCARGYDTNPARYDHNTAVPRGNMTDGYYNNGVYDGIRDNNRLDNNRTNLNNNNLNNTHRNGLTDGAINNTR